MRRVAFIIRVNIRILNSKITIKYLGNFTSVLIRGLKNEYRIYTFIIFLCLQGQDFQGMLLKLKICCKLITQEILYYFLSVFIKNRFTIVKQAKSRFFLYK